MNKRARWLMGCVILALTGTLLAQDAVLPLFDLPNANQYPLYTANPLFARRNADVMVLNPLAQTLAQVRPATGELLQEVPLTPPLLTLPDETELVITNNRMWVLVDDAITARQPLLQTPIDALWGDFTFRLTADALVMGYAPNPNLTLSLYQTMPTRTGLGRAMTIDTRQGVVYLVVSEEREAVALDARYRSRLVVLELATGIIRHDILLDLVDQSAHLPSALALTPDGRQLVLAYEASDRVAIIDTRTLQTVASFDTGSRPTALAISRDGGRVFVYNAVDQTLMVRDTRLWGLQDSIPTTTSTLAPDVQLGARLFYTARDPRMAWNQAMSCQTCHMPPDAKGVSGLNRADIGDFLNQHIMTEQGGTGLSVLEMNALIAFLRVTFTP